ncbi:hypothetical protein KBB48_00020 [Candidatus Shapirobacteria bacterium]|nr:hypothetical protein [Candidatus Shapirobacteria bacterium]
MKEDNDSLFEQFIQNSKKIQDDLQNMEELPNHEPEDQAEEQVYNDLAVLGGDWLNHRVDSDTYRQKLLEINGSISKMTVYFDEDGKQTEHPSNSFFIYLRKRMQETRAMIDKVEGKAKKEKRITQELAQEMIPAHQKYAESLTVFTTVKDLLRFVSE